MNLSEYFKYYIEPMSHKSILIFASINAFAVSFVENQLGLSVALICVYLFLSFIDLFLGVYKNVIYKKKAFKSELFLKKLFVIALTISFFYCLHQITLWANDIPIPNVVIDQFQGMFIYSLELSKVFLLFSFLMYELTSIRENAEAIKWDGPVEVIDIFLLPVTWIKEKLQNRIKDDTKRTD